MPLTPLDRNSTLRPTSADAAAHGANRVVPVAPVNQSTPEPSVIYEIKVSQPPREDVTYPNPSEHSAMKGPHGEPGERDWATKRAAGDKPKDPPDPPIAELLIENLRIVWMASAAAVQVQPEKDDGRLAGQQPQGYDIQKVRKTEKPE
ncbi:hypothetical protein KIK84_02280 [Curvibacter sp. CHRR-16]|uniref:hypothetical protein n=1 Tax=Curvibacter sp. CHRR-16 TaxID=2835872 RepID=UPI001BDA29D6|nr:hypothetical protein [Curvibacter sp. CHRR-16]MBT0569142.1 hypothetical protein [Curvibacter sp. CHRR-16]